MDLSGLPQYKGLIPPPTAVNNTHKVYSVAVACAVLAAVVTLICGAWLTHRFRERAFDMDDYALIVSLILYWGWTVVSIYINLDGGIGKPLVEITLPEYTLWYKGLVIVSFLYPVISTAIRVSILLFFRRIFTQGHNRTLRTMLHVLFALNAAYFFVFLILPGFTCRPIYYSWQFVGHAEHCNIVFYNNLTTALYSTSLFLDVFLLIFPISPITKLNLSLKKKIQLGFLFVFSSAAGIATAYKLAIWVSQETRMTTSNPNYFSYAISRYVPVQFDSQEATVWIPSQVEPTLGLIGASLPAVYQLLRRRFARSREKTNSLSDEQRLSRPLRTFRGSKRTPLGNDYHGGNESATLGLTDANIQRLHGMYNHSHTSSAVLDIACLTARDSLQTGEVNLPPLNQSTIEINWSQTCWTEPYCIIQPRSPGEVAKAIQIISFFEIKFAVRSGGHSPNPGWSSIGIEGILIDLENLNTITLSDDGTYASVGPGARWEDVYTTLCSHNTTVIGARVPSVGVGGMILGGGYSFFSNQFGLAADNVKNFEVVLASGDIINASLDENPDLFWSLKGGGPNFGIVTRYDLYTVPSIFNVWGTVLVYPVDQAPDVLAAFAEWEKTGASDTKTSVSLSIALDFITVGLMYSEPVSATPDAFSSFSKLTPLAVVSPPTNFTMPEVSRYSRCNGANQTFVLRYFGANLAQVGAQKGGNALNPPPGEMQWWTTTIDWEKEEDDDLVKSVSIDTTLLFQQLGQRNGSNLTFIYMNDAAQDQNPIESYGCQSIAKLNHVSRIYNDN
ncbi:hypothetical protein F5Y19DRAFT_468801 [Xylariaceae sp. FL1651]|nr:hypothetical protein F5Y19DRAFT_468801 [Xylariaceae sp. FL1651]